MDDFRLRVFASAAKNLSFTKCATEMLISQPAVSHHVGELEARYKVTLFNRRGARLELTDAGSKFLCHVERILQDYDTLGYEMGLLTNSLSGELRIGASTTIAQCLLPPVLARFIELFPNVKVSMNSGNSEQIEQELFDHDIDLGLVENVGRKHGLHYEDLIHDELVLVADARRKYGNMETVTLEELKKLPLVLRENGSGTLDVIKRQFSKRGVNIPAMNVVMQLGGTEAIKSFIHNSDTLAIVSILTVRDELRDGELQVIDIADMELTRELAFAWRVGEQNQLVERFRDLVKKSV